MSVRFFPLVIQPSDSPSPTGRGRIPTAGAYLRFWTFVSQTNDEENSVERHLKKQTTVLPIHDENKAKNESLLANAAGMHDPNTHGFCFAFVWGQRRRDPSRIPRSDARMPLTHGAKRSLGPR